MTSPHTHPAERETPAGEAMREAVAQWFVSYFGKSIEQGRRAADDLLAPAGPIASEHARLTAERDQARLAYFQACLKWGSDVAAAEAANTTLRADHAAEVARKDEEIARLHIATRRRDPETGRLLDGVEHNGMPGGADA